MKVTIFGATGRTGQHLLDRALERGHEVIAFTRSPEKLETEDENLSVVEGDVRDEDRVDRAIAGTDAVISVLGPTENKPVFAVSKGTANIIAAMKQHGVERLIVSVGAGVGDPKDEPKLFNNVINFLLKLFSRWVYEDMARVAAIVRQSDRRWTIVRIPMLADDEPTGDVDVGYVGKGMGFRLTRADLARFMLDQLEDETYLHEAPAISSKQ
jgi:nucleoside-diphosphate-sugar epimerase